MWANIGVSKFLKPMSQTLRCDMCHKLYWTYSLFWRRRSEMHLWTQNAPFLQGICVAADCLSGTRVFSMFCTFFEQHSLASMLEFYTGKDAYIKKWKQSHHRICSKSLNIYESKVITFKWESGFAVILGSHIISDFIPPPSWFRNLIDFEMKNNVIVPIKREDDASE